jgi:ubiquitin-protein ligase E3 A
MDGFTKKSKTVINFWEVLFEMPLDKQKLFLRFATGSDRVPIKGL